ncbi:MAG: SDR family oxidoreductase [Salaquimonas sp.]|nr:SDR family oxidoreductase [Salaquimonas sp.]
MNSEFEDESAIVTGAARGIGRITAELMAQRGARVLLADLDSDAVEKAASDLRAKGLTAQSVSLDLTNPGEYPALEKAVEQHFSGRVDVLVNNAGGWRFSTFDEISMQEWEWMFRTNTTSMFLATQAVKPMIPENGTGRIVNVASGAAHQPRTIMPHYAASKAAVVSLSRSYALELAARNILVNAVSPGPIATETLKADSNQEELNKLKQAIPLGRAGEPEDIAEVILFLASRRNRFMTGQTLVVNGGMFMI